MKLRTRSASCQMSSYCCWVIGMTICLAPRGTCVEGVFRSRSTCRVFGRASILASPSLERSRMTKMPPAGYPAFLQYLQSGRVFDFRISLGTVHNIVHSPVAQARRINQQYDLSTIVIGLLDEIFQARDPVLVGVDAQSTFCFLLSPEEHRDADTWGVRLLELVDQGFAPKATIADFGSGLRAGHQEVLPEVPCRGDVFHALYHTGPLVRYLENRAYEAMDVCAKLERKQATTARRRGCKDQSLATKLSYARPAEAKAIVLADEVALLARWLRDDILSVAGPEYAIRRDLLDFVEAELRARESACPQRIGPVRTLLENQRDNLLAFAVELDRELAALAQKWQISVATAREVLQVQSLPTWDPKRWHREAALRETLRGHYHGV